MPDLHVVPFITRDELIQARKVSPVDAAVHRRDPILAPDGGPAAGDAGRALRKIT
jgi:hypothetical protein